MSKLVRKLSRRILAIALSVAMAMPNMAVYASEVSVPDTQEKITVNNDELNEAQASLTEGETDTDEAAEEVAEAPLYTENAVSGSNADKNGASDDLENSGVVAYNVTNDETTLSAVFRSKHTDLTSTGYAGFEFNGFEATCASDGHGAKSSQADATIKFTVPGVTTEETKDIVDIDVLLCAFGTKTAAKMTAAATGVDTPLTVLKEIVGEDDDSNKLKDNPAPKYTVFGVAGGSEVTLTFENSGTYVHSIVATKRSEAKYSIEVEGDDNGTASVSPVYAKAGAPITLTAKPNTEYELDAWTVESPTTDKPAITKNAEDANKATFAMPAANVKIKASFKEVVGATYNVNVLNGYHGSATLKTGQGTGIAKDAEVILANVVEVTPEAGYTFKEWYVTQIVDNKIVDVTVTDGKFTMPAGNVDVMPVFSGTAKDGYTYSFRGKSSTNRAQNAQLKDYGIITFEGFKDADNEHGFITDGQNGEKAVMKLNLSGKATVVVETCCYGTSNVTAKIGETSYTPAKDNNTSEAKPNTDPVVYSEIYTVTTDKGGELELTFNDNNAYIHSVTVTYIDEGGSDPDPDPDPVYTDKIDVWDFGLATLDTDKYNNRLTREILSAMKFTDNAYEKLDEDEILRFHTYQKEKAKLYGQVKESPYTDAGTLKDINDDSVTYDGYLYINSASSDYWFEIEAEAGDVVTVYASYNTNPAQYSFFKIESNTIKKGTRDTINIPDGAQKATVEKGSGTRNEATPLTFYVPAKGKYAFCTSNATAEKLVVARVTRQHSKVVKVSGTVDMPKGTEDKLTLLFTCKESGAVKEAEVAGDGSYEVDCFENYSYDIVVYPTTYVISEGAELELGAANADCTAAHDIMVNSVLLRTLSGSIVGLDNATDSEKAALTISLKKPEDKIYTPKVTVDKTAMTYTAQLETGVEYTIVTEGINDYELNNTANNNSDRIRITSDTIGRNITYTKKPVYTVTIEPEGATLADLAGAKFTFTNINEAGYVYTFTGTNGIQLRDGTYSIVVEDPSGKYKQKLTTNLVVNGEDVTKPIAFISDPVTKWDFTDASNYEASGTVKNPCNGLSYTGDGTWKYKDSTYGSQLSNITISVPVSGSGKVVVYVGYQWNISSTGVTINNVTESGADGGKNVPINIPYSAGTDKVDITVAASPTSYIKMIEVVADASSNEYEEIITVGQGKDYATINEALDAVRSMKRTAGQVVTIEIDPGDYEEMLVIDVSDIKLKNASAAPSIGLRNKGVDIDPNAVRITGYYGHGYTYYSMGSDCKWNAEILAINKANGYPAFANPGTGTTSGSYWNATVVINASNVSAEGIIFENSFNQYISKKAAEDIIVAQSGAKEGSVPRASMAEGDTKVQEKDYVERAAALAICNNCAKISFDNCKFVGRQDTLYGGTGVTAAFYDCSIYGAVDYIMGGMTAVFAKCDLVFNTSDLSDKSKKEDVGYITAAQQESGRGYLMYNCHVTSTIPGVDTASQYTSKPGGLGRPWQPNTGEAVFYKTVVDEVDSAWQEGGVLYDTLKDDYKKDGVKSLIMPEGWNAGLNGKSGLSQECGTYEVAADTDNSSKRVDWAKVLTPDAEGNVTLADGTTTINDNTAVSTFLSSWSDAFAGKDMTIVLPSDADIAAPAAPTAIVTPEPTKEGEGETAVEKVIKGASIVLSAEAGAKVYYNVNAATDAVLNEDSTPYKGAIEVKDSNIANDNTITITAIAVKYGKSSSVAKFTYDVVSTPDTVAPEFTPATNSTVKLGDRITISAAAGAEIYYNVNAPANPSDAADDEDSELYTGKDGIEITNEMVKGTTDSSVTIKAIAKMYGKLSTVTTATYNVVVNAPTANYKNGYQFPDCDGKVELTADEGVTILYTMGDNPGDPTLAASRPITYNKDTGIKVTADTTIKAVAKRGTKYSEVVTLNYIVPLSMPTATPESGAKLPTNGRVVKLQADAGATIYYTMGADPADPASADSGRLTYSDSGITVTENTTIKAVASKGDRYSTVAVFTYEVVDEEYPQVANPTVTKLTVNDEEVTGNTITVDKDANVTIKLETATEDADIYYTLNGKEPTASSNKYKKETGIVISEIKENTTVNAIAVMEGMLDSGVLAITINVRANDSHEDEVGLVIELTEGDSYEYTGSAIKPEVEVRNNGKPLTPNVDYTVKYSNNINVPASGSTKLPTVTVTGKGLLSGTTKKTFTITPKDIDDEDVIVGRITVVATKKVPAPTVYYGSTKLKAGKDFTYTAPTPYSAAGDNEFTITGSGNFKETTTVKVKVVADAAALKAALKKFKVTVDTKKAKTDLIYDGTDLKAKIMPLITVDPSTADHTIVWQKDLTNAGTVKFTVVGLGDYSGCNISKSCKILPSTIKAENVVINDTGAKTAAAGQVLVSGGNGAVTFASMGATYEELSLTYGPDEKEMTLGKDYKVSYSSNKKVADGKAKYTISFMGNYKGKYTSAAFDIKEAELDNTTAEVVTPDMVCNGKPGVYKAKPYVSVDGVTLKASEYEVEYYTDADRTAKMDKNNKLTIPDSGYATVYIRVVPNSKKSNYKLADTTKALTDSYTVWKNGDKAKDLSKAKITFHETGNAKNNAKVGYTGDPVQPDEIWVTIGGTDHKILKGNDANNAALPFTYEIVNNTNKGSKAVVIIKAKSDNTPGLTGGKTGTFSVSAKNIKDFTITSVAQAMGNLFK